jgi:TetR/AcrR family transcriptional regulator, transcriptional repressor for nem operon
MRYEKGRKDASRRRIMEVAAGSFRRDGIAASGLAGIMSEAGLTNGAFYPHFHSKADLVRESVAATMDDQSDRLRDAFTDGGLEAVLALYLSAKHRDNPESGCALAALLPELARQPPEARRLYAERFLTTVRRMEQSLPPGTKASEGSVLALYATLIGTLQLARAFKGTALSDRILTAGADAARALVPPHRNKARHNPMQRRKRE